MTEHDPMTESVLIEYPKDDPVYPGAVMSVHPNNGQSSIENAAGVHPRARIVRWETSGEPYVGAEDAVVPTSVAAPSDVLPPPPGSDQAPVTDGSPPPLSEI